MNVRAPNMHKGWHSRGYLPHFDAPRLVQAVTFRLADSLPREAVARLGADPAAERRRVAELLDAGHGACVLRDPRVAAIVEGALLAFDGQRYLLIAWVVMPNHVHAVLEPLTGHPLPAIVKSWKAFTAAKANAILGRRGRLWQPDYFDRYIRDGNHLGRTVEYVENNPVKAGLAERPEEWPWGSARFLERGSSDPHFSLRPSKKGRT